MPQPGVELLRVLLAQLRREDPQEHRERDGRVLHRPACYGLVVSTPPLHRDLVGVGRGVRGDPAVELVERALPQQHHPLEIVEQARAHQRVVVHETAARRVEALVEPAELVPHPGREEQRIRLELPEEPATRTGLVHRRDLVEAIPVRRPVDRLQQAVLVVLGPPGIELEPLEVEAEVPAKRRDRRPRVDPTRGDRVPDESRRTESRAVDHDPDGRAPRFPEPTVDRRRRRRRRVVDSHETELTIESVEERFVHRCRRPVVDDDDLVVRRVDPLLVADGE